MKTINLLLIIVTASVITILSSCGKSGCRDQNACNYDPDATKDNQSCKYNQDVPIASQTVNLDKFATSTPFAEFEFSQVKVESCHVPDVTEVRLQVKNVTSDTVSISCEIVMQLDAFTQYWTYNYSVNHLPPGAIDDVGVISTDPTAIEGKEFDFPGIYTTTIH